MPAIKLSPNRFKRALDARQRQFGMTARLCSPDAVEVMSRSGFGYIMLDAEHTPNTLPMIQSQLRAMLGGTAEALVRPAWNDTVLIKGLLDIGVRNLLVPMVQNAADARAAVAATRYPPAGVRGVNAVTRATQYGRVTDYFSCVQAEMCVIAMIETQQALDNLDEIAGTDGIDGIEFGALDLSFDLGLKGDSRHETVVSAITDGIRRVLAAGKAPGITAYVESQAREWLDAGCRFVTVGSDLNLVTRYSDQLASMFPSGSA